MDVTFEVIRKTAVGALASEIKESGISFGRFTPSQLALWDKHDATLGARARATTGIRLDFHTSSKNILIETGGEGKFELWTDGVLVHSFDAGKTAGCQLPLTAPYADGGAEEHRVTLYFPAHDCAGTLKRLALDDGAYVREHSFDIKLLFMGDSITQGWAAEHDSLSYAHRVSRCFNAESVIQGVGGACFFSDILEPIPFEPNWVLVAYGTNDFSTCGDVGAFRQTLEKYMSRLETLYSHSKVFVITPIWRERTQGKCGLDLGEWRRLIADTTEKHDFTVIDGALLVPPATCFYTDGLHPNDNGFSLYAERLTELLKIHGGK